MKRRVLLAALIAVGCYASIKAQTNAGKDNHQWKLVWSDEFNYKGLPDKSKWGYDTGGHGWGNHEREYYTEKRLENASVKDGMLSITAIKEPYKNAEYTSARLVSKNKGDWKYGRIEVRAKLPKGRGLWPAIWMLPSDWKYGDWPTSGEIDIMEHVGYERDSIYGTVHTGAYNHRIGTQKGSRTFRTDLSDTFHNYTLVWTENKMEMYVDDENYFTFLNEKKTEKEWPFDQRFHLLLNVAVGGDWGGKKGVDDSVFPQQMLVDYVRVYQQKK